MHETSIAFNQNVQSFSVYLFNIDATRASSEHGVAVAPFTSEFTVTEVPFEFSPTLGLVLSSGMFGLVKLRSKLKTNSEM